MESENPENSAKRYGGWGVALRETSIGVADAYKLSEIRDEKHEWLIEGDRLGLQYGLADLLERMNYRFYHPYQSYIPEEIKIQKSLILKMNGKNQKWSEEACIYTRYIPLKAIMTFGNPVMVIYIGRNW